MKLTKMQQEFIKVMVDLYEKSGRTIKCEEIAESIHRTPGTVRNQMQILKNLKFVKGVPGPRGGYLPTVLAYENLKFSQETEMVPVYINNRLSNVMLKEIHLKPPNNGILHVMGDIRNFKTGDRINIASKRMKRMNPWLESWTERVADDAYCNDPAYWSNTAREYDRKILANGRLLEKLKQYVNSDSTVLDIGAGTGYLTLVFAPFVKKITAVEPAEGMLNILKEKAGNMGIHNIEYIDRKWEDAKTGKYDVVLASHSICCTQDPLTFFIKMHECARRYVFLIVFTDFDIISTVGRQTPQPSYVLLYNMLCSLGIYANIEIFKGYRRFFYMRKEDAIIDLDDRINNEYIRSNLKEINGEFFLDIEADEAMIWYKNCHVFLTSQYP